LKITTANIVIAIMRTFFYTITLALLTACSDPYNVHMNGEDYKLMRKGYTNKDGTRIIPLYEKRGNTNNYYTPSLTVNHMISIMK
jgi:hypothetical protein